VSPTETSGLCRSWTCATTGLRQFAYLKSRNEIDPIGVWGLSQGGWLGPLAVSRSADVSYVIAVSGPGVSPGEQMIVCYANELRARGIAETDIQEASILRLAAGRFAAKNGQIRETHSQ
jgi:hypothetical protein